jgi:thiamine-phosphate pyrophosphorylase
MKFTQDEIRKGMLLYAVTDQSWLKEGQTLLKVCEDVLSNGATFLQIREKDLDADSFEAEAARLKALCAQYKVPYVVNDSVEIAMAIDADGVHVGQSDIKGRDIRSMIGKDKILGISAGTIEEAIAAEKAGADYIGVGAVFATGTKKNARNLSVEALKKIVSAVSIPVVAIGGINSKNLMELCGSGVDGVAVVSAIFAAEDPGEATAQLLELAREMVRYG